MNELLVSALLASLIDALIHTETFTDYPGLWLFPEIYCILVTANKTFFQ